MLQVYLSLLDTQAEKDKFIQVYEAYRDLMFYIARRYLAGDADREIAVDGALHALLGVLESLDDPFSTKTKNLVALITRNKCIDVLRRRGGASEESWEESGGEETLPAKAPDAAADDLSLAIRSLRETSRDVLILRYYYGYSAAEIGKILGIGRDAARKRLERAKKELKEMLEGDA